MIIIPFIHDVKYIAPMQISIFRILTVGGKDVWKENNDLDLVHDILEPNGIYLSSPPIQWNQTYLCPVDTTKTQLNDFYDWKEVQLHDPETFCWRTFYITGDKTNYRSWLPIPRYEMVGPYRCEEIFDMIHQKQVI